MGKIKTIKAKHNVARSFNKLYIIKIIIATFFISCFLSYLSDNTFSTANIIVSSAFVLFFVFVGILFDTIGIASTSANEKPFHAMNSKKVKSADVAVYLIRNADKVSNICNDVVGDISGIISGSAGAAVAIKIADLTSNTYLKIIIPLIVISVISTLTISGKAVCKVIAINHSNTIIYNFARIINVFYKRK